MRLRVRLSLVALHEGKSAGTSTTDFASQCGLNILEPGTCLPSLKVAERRSRLLPARGEELRSHCGGALESWHVDAKSPRGRTSLLAFIGDFAESLHTLHTHTRVNLST
jgi:hypothetical protein